MESINSDHHRKKILVTGGAGFIGSHTVVELFKAGFEPIIVDDFSNSHPYVIEGIEKIVGKKPTFYQLNCNDLEALRQIGKDHDDIDGLIHFAAYKLVGESVRKPIKYYDNNLNSNISITRFCIENKIRPLVFSSSCTVYGVPDVLPVSEDAPIKPAESAYGRTKQIGEFFFEDCVKGGLPLNVISLRYFNPIGADPSAEIGELPLSVPNNLVPYITQTGIGIREELTVFGNDYETSDGTCIRDYIHVVDLAKAHIAALNLLLRKSDSPPSIEFYNIGSGKGNSVLEIIEAFQKVSGKKLPFKIGDRREGDVPMIYADSQKAFNEMGWKAEYSMEDALAHAWKWEQRLPGLNLNNIK